MCSSDLAGRRQDPARARTGTSAHADQQDLLDWLGHLERPPHRVWLVHGEEENAGALAQVIRERLGWPVGIAEDRATVSVDA